MREVARFADVYEAELAVSFLASNGIWSVAADNVLATMDPLMQRALGGIRVMTLDDQVDEALVT